MQITKFGEKQIDSNGVEAYLLGIAVAHIHEHLTPMEELKTSLRFVIARLLCATGKGSIFAPASDLYNLDEFLKENAALLEKYVDRTLNDALLASKEPA